ncbi:MAG: hypothetical protein HFG78_16700 [Hungatella sp.]|nr:hypothetical protein [Hungatella sp.]
MNKVKPVNYKKEKHRFNVGIGASVFVLTAGLIFGLTGLFFYMDAIGQAAAAQKREETFDPWADSARNGRLSWMTGKIIGLTEEFAADFKETYHYYFAFDEDWYPFIVKMKGALGEEFQPYEDYVYEDGAQMPEPMTLTGVAIPIEEDIREFAIECLNLLYDEEFITEDNFEDYMGVSLLDTTQKPVGRADFSAGAGFAVLGVVFTAVGLLCLVLNIMNRNRLEAEERKVKENMRRVAAWQSNPWDDHQSYEDTAGYDRGTYQENPGYGSDSQIPLGSQGTWQSGGGVESGQGTGGDQTYYVNGVKLTPLKKSNMFLGIIGAIGGSLIGVVLWLGISFVGFIAGIAGFAMLKFALLGYEKLSGRLDKKGAVISLVIAAGMVFFANVLDYVVTICRAFFQWEASLDTVLYVISNFGTLMTDADCWGGFAMNLIIGYALSIWSSFQLIGKILRYKES